MCSLTIQVITERSLQSMQFLLKALRAGIAMKTKQAMMARGTSFGTVPHSAVAGKPFETGCLEEKVSKYH